MVERDRVYTFLMGFNIGLNEVRGRIFGIKPLPKIWGKFSKVKREEGRRKVMLGKSIAVPSIERSAVAARGN